jgi:NTE family protein
MRKFVTYLFLFVWVTVVSAQNMYTGQSEKFSTFNSQLSTQEFGLVLSGGGALGFAHIGAIKALEEYGIEPKYVAGTSMGAIIGVMYAAGYSADEIMQIVKEDRLYKVGRLITMQSALRNSGMSTHKTLLRELAELIPHNSFDSLERKFMVCVTSVETGEAVYRHKGGYLKEYVAASASIPGVFEPIIIDSVRYIDGGIVDNLPVSQLLALNPQLFIIGVDVLPFVENYEAKNSIDMLLWMSRLFQSKNMDPNRAKCDWLIQSFALNEYHGFEFKRYKEIYQYGYDAMKAKLQSIERADF